MSDRQLRFAIEAQKTINVDRAIDEMKGSALARSNWEQLITPAPVVLKCLGACFMAAGSKDTRTIRIPKLSDATLDRPEDLSANLIRCSTLGTTSFLEANKNMAELYQLCGVSDNKAHEILELLGDPRAASRHLPISLRALQENADACFQASKRTDESLSEWLLLAKELYEACQSKSGADSGDVAKTIIDKAIAIQRVADSPQQIVAAKASMDELGKTFDVARQAFKKASDSRPSGWDFVGQEIVNGVGQSVIGGINATFGRIGNGASQGNNSGSSNTIPKSNPALPVSDPAFACVAKDLYLYNLLKPMVINSKGDFDWDLASGGDNSGVKSGAAFLETMLKDSKDGLNRQTGGGPATTTYQKILDDAIKIAGEINKTLKDSAGNIYSSRPQKDSEIVVRWQTLTKSLYEDVYALKLQGANSAFSPSSSIGVIFDSNLESPRIDANTPHGAAFLQAASANLKATADQLDSTNNLYGENVKRLSEQQSGLMDVNAALAKLTTNVIGLEESKQILLQCIGLIIQLKARIVDLVDFFSNILAVIKTISSKLVSQWVETIKTAGRGSEGSGADIKIGQFSLESTERTMIMNSVVCIGAYFSFFADVANSWRGVSDRSIFPGIQLAEELSLPGDASSKMNKLDQWSKSASGDITKLLSQKRTDIQGGMSERVNTARDQLRDLPPPSSAIEQITQKVLPQLLQADVKAIDAQFNNSPVAILTGKARTD